MLTQTIWTRQDFTLLLSVIDEDLAEAVESAGVVRTDFTRLLLYNDLDDSVAAKLKVV